MTSAKLMLDSGAFTAWTKGTKIDIDEYIAFCRKHENLFDHCVNLDVIGNAKDSYHNWKYMRKAGIDALPIFHLGTDERWLEKYLKQTDYIGIGAVANTTTPQRILGLTRIWKNYLVGADQRPIVKVHGMGLTALSSLLRYPWYSADSASPSKNSGFGQIYIPNLTKGINNPQYFKLTTIKISDQAHHTVGKKSFLTLSQSVQEKYTKFFEKYGFELGNITYQEIRSRRTIKLRREDPPKLGLLKPLDKPDSEKITLANNAMLRYKWNLHIWRCLIDRLPPYDRKLEPEIIPKEEVNNSGKKTTIHIVAATAAYLKATLEVKPEFDLLTSYIYLNNNTIQTLEKHRL